MFGSVIAKGLDYRETFQIFQPGFDLDKARQQRADAGKPEWFGVEVTLDDGSQYMRGAVPRGFSGIRLQRSDFVPGFLLAPVVLSRADIDIFWAADSAKNNWRGYAATTTRHRKSQTKPDSYIYSSAMTSTNLQPVEKIATWLISRA